MGVEIERKFLVENDTWQTEVSRKLEMTQGYLVATKERSVRVRISEAQAFVTIKGAARGTERSEFEYEVPVADGKAMLELCERPLIEKTRHEVAYRGHVWEVDVFHGDNLGLVVAEIELDSVDEVFDRPTWLGQEVSDDARYLNANLFRNPYNNWKR